MLIQNGSWGYIFFTPFCYVIDSQLPNQAQTEVNKVSLQESVSLSFDLSFLTQNSMAQTIYHDKVEKPFSKCFVSFLSFSTQLESEIISQLLIGLEKKAFASVVSTSEGDEVAL